MDFIITTVDGIIKLPINPEELPVGYTVDNKTVDVVGIGEVNILGGRKLFEFEINSYVPADNIPSPTEINLFFGTLANSGKPARFTVTELQPAFDVMVSIESYQRINKAGEEDDLYFVLSLKQYKAYGAQIMQVLQATEEETQVLPTLPERIDEKPPVQQTYTVRSGDNLTAITRRLSPGGRGDWRDLYNIPANRVTIGNNPNLIYPGQVYIIPESWVTA